MVKKNMENEVNNYRLKSVYCYDFMENPKYADVQRVLQKIRRMNGQNVN